MNKLIIKTKEQTYYKQCNSVDAAKRYLHKLLRTTIRPSKDTYYSSSVPSDTSENYETTLYAPLGPFFNREALNIDISGTQLKVYGIKPNLVSSKDIKGVPGHLNEVCFAEGDQEILEHGLKTNHRLVVDLPKSNKVYKYDFDTAEALDKGRKAIESDFSKNNLICTIAHGEIGKVFVLRMCNGFPSW